MTSLSKKLSTPAVTRSMSHNKTSFKEILARIFLRLIPFRILSRLIRFLSRWENEAWKNWIIKKFARRYQINTKEAVSRNLKHYPSFNHFFTREIKPELRPVTEIENGIASPVDGLITQIGKISDGNLIQAKGRQFNVSALLAGESKTAEQFRQGFFATLRLMPEDYHRIHMPLNATLMETVHVPGQLFSIGNDNGDKIPGIVAKNERVICVFSTKSGPMAMVLVGSIFSSSIETVWDGEITLSKHSEIRRWHNPYNPPSAKKGEEMGRFNLGSTVVLLLGNGKVSLEPRLKANSKIKMGELMGRYH